jgi:hypothetical protein
VHIRRSKAGKERHVVLTDEGRDFFNSVRLGRPALDLIFTLAGHAWKKTDQQYPLRAD